MSLKLDGLLDRLELDGIVGLDMETFWSKEFTLKKIPTTEYICDPQFKTHMCSIQWHDEKKAVVLDPKELKDWTRQVDWKRTGMLAHHTHFDGLIASRHFKTIPAMYLDTLSMCRAVLPVTAGNSLVNACAAFGRRSKKRGGILLKTQGLRDLSPDEFHKMALYAGDDIADTWWLFGKLLPYLPEQELRVIDATVRMYCQPRLLIDEKKVRDLHDAEVKAKINVCKRLKATAEELRSKTQFARLLEDAGCDPPMKQNKKGAWIHAFSKQDLAFKALLGHESSRVRALTRGRFRLSSSIVEKRAQRMMKRAPLGPQPVYLNYAGALTFRWSGSDKMNWQNPNRGSDLRAAIMAPPGHELIIADSAQIEARINAEFAGQKDKIEQFRAKQDVYAITATKIYGRTITKEKNKTERDTGKVADLSLGYQAGGPRFAHMLRIGVMGADPQDVSDQLAKDFVTGWRQANSMIVANWRATNNLVKQAFVLKTRVEHGCVAYEGVGQHGYMHLPNGMSIRYANLQIEEDNSISYLQKPARGKGKKGEPPKEKRKRLYGGLLVENRTQALARVLLADNIVQILMRAPYLQLVLTVHDELVFVSPTKKSAQGMDVIREVMTQPPVWMPNLPLGIDAAISRIYSK